MSQKNPSDSKPAANSIRVPLPSRTARLKGKPSLKTTSQMSRSLTWKTADLGSGRFRIMLYRFIAEHVPAASSCLWTWVRMAAAPGRFELSLPATGQESSDALARLERLWKQGYVDRFGNRIGLETLLPDLFMTLFRDGMFGGFITVAADQSSVDRFVPIDPINITAENPDGQSRIYLNTGLHRISLMRPDYYHLSFNSDPAHPLGRSLLQPIQFVSYIEQQLVDDMRRTSHNSGYHRLHVKISPPDRLSGESDTAYTDRINSYFDSTVRMIKDCELDENPVTWDNVAIEYIGPDKSREVSNSWFVNHRSMIEEVCAGTNLAPFLLGYSYGATTTWAAFKFDVVMRQVRSVQSAVARFLEWLGNIELALAGSRHTCRFVFDNSFAYQAADHLALSSGHIDNLLKLLDAGLISETTAREKACRLI